MTADVGDRQYREALDILLSQETVDGALVIATPTGTISSATVVEAILEAHRRSPKALVACLFGVTDLSNEMGHLELSGIPAFTFPEEAVGALGILARYQAWKIRARTEVRTFQVDQIAAERTIASARENGRSVLPEYSARALLEAYGIRFPVVSRVASAEEAVREAEAMGYPVVLKVASPDISHKTEVGGVAIGIGSAEALVSAFRRIEASVRSAAPTARIEGYEVQGQVEGGKEVLVGIQRDPDFGPIVVFGMGGIYVELLRDVTFRLAPLVTRSAQRMIESTSAFALLSGVRGERPSDLAALEEVIERIAQLAVEHPEIAELDVNPLIVLERGRGAMAVDARVVLTSPK